jgi:SAM-dependent methyltransferase
VTATLPLTVLAWEGPMARAYLARMARAGLRPERILLMVKPPSPMRLGRWLQERSHLHHPLRLRKQHPELVKAITDAMAPDVEDAAALLNKMYDGFAYEHYADEVRPIAASSHKDPAVIDALRAMGPATVLFTGGGIVPSPVLALPGLRLIHVHTGFLPYVRGADVLLWSTLVRGRPGVSAFIMAPGLDHGDVVAARECRPLQVVLPGRQRLDDMTLYRAVFSFMDPLIRAELLVNDVLAPPGKLAALESAPQDLDRGITYHFMHPELRGRALRQLFASPPPSADTRAGVTPDSSSSAAYQRYYDAPSRLAAIRFGFDALVAPARLRSLSLRNRRKDYVHLSAHPERRPLHAEFNRQLALQEQRWDSHDYGEGWFYQSSAELGITGLRDTAGRVDAFNLLELVGGKSVLEIGCNTGFLSLAVAAAAARTVAFDANPYLIAIAEAARRFLNRQNVEFLVSDFESFASEAPFDVVLSFANHHTYDGRMRLDLETYFARCHALTRRGGRLVFESHPPELEGNAFGHTLAIIERFYTIERSEIHDYGTFLDRRRRFLVAVRREQAS